MHSHNQQSLGRRANVSYHVRTSFRDGTQKVFTGLASRRYWCEFGANFNINNTIKSPSRLSAITPSPDGLFVFATIIIDGHKTNQLKLLLKII